MERKIAEAIAQYKDEVIQCEESCIGAVLVLFSEDFMKVVRIGETPELDEFKEEIGRAYAA